MVKKTGIILTIFVIFIMITSILGFMSGSGDEGTVKYKGHKFTKVQNGWIGYINNQKILLGSSPTDLEDIEVGIKLDDLNSATKAYVSVNPEDNLILYAFQSIGALLRSRTVRACNEEVAGCEDLPIKTCSDATKAIKVILIKQDEKFEYFYKNNCLLIKGSLKDIGRVLDKIILELLT